MAYNFRRVQREFGSFMRQYRRISNTNFDPNDRGYDRKIEEMTRRMKPEDLYKIMTDSDKNIDELDWPFADPMNVAVFTSKQIIKGKCPVLHVSHDEEDGAWQFHTGSNIKEEDAMIVSLKEIYNFDKSIGLLADLPFGYIAERKDINSEWIIKKHE